MEYFAGIDVSLEQSSVCVVDGTGKIVREAVAASRRPWSGSSVGWRLE
jgi:predicted NBD/HSP70 family sugar kinase